MARLIDADRMREDWLENGENEYVYDTNAVLESIDEQPTVDAVEVVRCENCEHFMEDIFKRTVCNRTFNMFVMQANDFCSYGKKKIGGERE